MKPLALLLIAGLVAGCTRDEFGSRDDGGALVQAPTEQGTDNSPNNASGSANNGAPDYGAGQNNQSPDGEVPDLSGAFGEVGSETMMAIEAVTRATFTDLRATSGNVVFSPVSMVNTLVVTGLAGNDATRQAASVRLASDAFQEIGAGIAQVAEVAQSQNVLLFPTYWVGLDTELTATFVDNVYPGLLRDVRTVDFSQPDVARQTINNYYRTQTEGVITSAVGALSLEGGQSAALVDAVYFHQSWAQPFDAALTSEGVFESVSGPQTSLFMNQVAEFPVTRGDGWDAVVLPYTSQFSLVAVVPSDSATRSDIEAKFSVEFIDQVVALAAVEYLDLSFPKMEVEGRLDSMLFGSEVAANAGQDDGLEASGATGGTALVQRAVIAFDEAGTTGIAVGDSDAVANAAARRFAVDRPFLFAVRDHSTGILVLAGRVMRP